VLRLRTNGAVNLLPLYAFMTWTRTTLPLPCAADSPFPYSAVAVTTAQSLGTVTSLTADQSQAFIFPALGLALSSVTIICIVTIFRDLPLLPVQFVMEPRMYRILKETCNSRVAVRHLVVQTLQFQNGGCLSQIPSQDRLNSLQT
jgi:hypothetical protein